MITLRRAVREDIPNIMKFMDEYWKPGNILAKNQAFFEWQFVNDDDTVNMFIGIDEDIDKIYGMIGAVIYNKSEAPAISGCTWQTIKSSNPMLGIELSDYMLSQLRPSRVCSIGMTKKSIKINELLGRVSTTMDHYYRLANRQDYKIAQINNKNIPRIKDTGYSLSLIHSVKEMKQIISEEVLAGMVMSKDYSYITKRYFEHPIYHYDIWKILDEQKVSSSVLITRDEKANDGTICKIIDFYGKDSDLGKITVALDCLMVERGYEFIDIYSYGVPTEIYENAGFCPCNETSENIIPNYFHPFERKNITLRMIDPMVPDLRMFRGDGDQDRPC